MVDMKQQHMVLFGALALVFAILVWQGVAVAPDIDSGTSQLATTTVPEVEEGGSMPPSNDSETLPSPTEIPEEGPTMCTMDAKECPDGSYVGRVGPDCAFAACPAMPPNGGSEPVVCSEEMSEADVCPAIYAPVCGLVEIQCITTPCNPIPETFSNGCSACARGNVLSYTDGACSVE